MEARSLPGGQAIHKRNDYLDPSKNSIHAFSTDRRLPSTSSLLAFEATARLGGFSGAARELSLSQSTVSYRVRQLEERLGIALFLRLTRRTELTLAGARLLPRVQRILHDLDDAIDSLGSESDRVLRLRLSTYFAMRWLSPRLRDWSGQGGGPVLFIHDAASPADLEIRWGPTVAEPGTLLMATGMTAYVAPALLARIHTPADLLSLTLLSEPAALDMWPRWFRAAGLVASTGYRRMVLADSNVRVQAAVDGLGAVLADQLVAAEVAASRLVAPFDIVVHGSGYQLLMGEETVPGVQRFVDWLHQNG